MGTEALGTALSGLRVAQKGLDVVASNVSNANTEGYTKKILSQETIVSDGVGVGVRYNEITRYVDQAVQRDYRAQMSISGYSTARESYLSRVVALHGATDNESNTGAYLSRLQNAFVELSASPDARASQQNVVNQAQNFAASLNSLSNNLLSIRNDTQKALATETDNLNATLKQIADLNRAIAPLKAVGKSTAALEDQRDVLVKKVAEMIDISTFTDGDGVLVLQTKQGQVLADTDARPLVFKNESVTSASVYPDNLGGLLLMGVGGESVDLAQKNPGGKLGALLELRDKDLPAYSAQLDALAYTVAVRFNDQGVRLFTDNLGTIPANNPAIYNGFAANIKVNDYVVSNPGLLQTGTSGGSVNAGDNSVIMKVVNYTFGRFKDAVGTLNVPFTLQSAGAGRNLNIAIVGDEYASLTDFASGMIDAQAGDYNIAKTAKTTEEQYTKEIETRLLDASAVDTDSEMARMIELQKNYAASAKMIGALDQLFQELLNAIR